MTSSLKVVVREGHPKVLRESIFQETLNQLEAFSTSSWKSFKQRYV